MYPFQMSMFTSRVFSEECRYFALDVFITTLFMTAQQLVKLAWQKSINMNYWRRPAFRCNAEAYRVSEGHNQWRRWRRAWRHRLLVFCCHVSPHCILWFWNSRQFIAAAEYGVVGDVCKMDRKFFSWSYVWHSMRMQVSSLDANSLQSSEWAAWYTVDSRPVGACWAPRFSQHRKFNLRTRECHFMLSLFCLPCY